MRLPGKVYTLRWLFADSAVSERSEGYYSVLPGLLTIVPTFPPPPACCFSLFNFISRVNTKLSRRPLRSCSVAVALFISAVFLSDCLHQSKRCAAFTAVLFFDETQPLAEDWASFLPTRCTRPVSVSHNPFWEVSAFSTVSELSPASSTYVGVVPFVPYKLEHHLQVTAKESKAALAFGTEKAYDVVALVYFDTANLAQAVASHGPAFAIAWDMLLTSLGFPVDEIRKHDNVSGFYSNAWYARRVHFDAYSSFAARAMDAVRSNSTVRNALTADSGYSLTKYRQVRLFQAVYGLNRAPVLPFVFERLPAFFFATRDASVYHHKLIPQALNESSPRHASPPLSNLFGLERRASFSLVGLGKSGSSALMWYLENHPSISHVVPKETCFFDDPDLYRAYAAATATGAVYGDSCLKLSVADAHLHDMYSSFVLKPNATIILLVRNPIKRLYASYWYWCTSEELRNAAVKEYCDAHGGWNPRTTVGVAGGNYTFRRSPQEFHHLCTIAGTCIGLAFDISKTVSGLHSRYGDRLMLVSSEKLYANTGMVLDEIVARLGLPAYDFSHVTNSSVNVNGVHLKSFISRKQRGRYPPMLPETIKWARPFLERQCEALEASMPSLCEEWLDRGTADT